MWTWIRIFTDVLFPISLDRGQDEAAVLMNKPAMAGGVGSHWLGIAEIFTTCPDTNVSVGECHGLERDWNWWKEHDEDYIQR